MNYKIVNFDETNGSVVINYNPNMPNINVDIPLDENGLFIVGEELDNYIKGFIPTWHLERIEKIAQGIPNADQIKALVEEPPIEEVPTISEEAIANSEMWEKIYFEKRIGDALVKFGVLESNPVNIPVEQL